MREYYERVKKYFRKRWDFLSFINSPFLLTVIIGLIVWRYQAYVEAERKADDRLVRCQKIATEIQYRIETSEVDANEAVDITNRLDGIVIYPLSREFKQVPLVGMLWQMIPLCDSDQSREQLRALIDNYRALSKAGGDRLKAYRAFLQRARAVIRPHLPKGLG